MLLPGAECGVVGPKGRSTACSFHCVCGTRIANQPGDALSAEVILDCSDSGWESVRIRALLRLLGHR